MLDRSKVNQIPILDISQFFLGDEVAKCSMADDLRWIQKQIGFYYITLVYFKKYF